MFGAVGVLGSSCGLVHVVVCSRPTLGLAVLGTWRPMAASAGLWVVIGFSHGVDFLFGAVCGVQLHRV